MNNRNNTAGGDEGGWGREKSRGGEWIGRNGRAEGSHGRTEDGADGCVRMYSGGKRRGRRRVRAGACGSSLAHTEERDSSFLGSRAQSRSRAPLRRASPCGCGCDGGGRSGAAVRERGEDTTQVRKGEEWGWESGQKGCSGRLRCQTCRERDASACGEGTSAI